MYTDGEPHMEEPFDSMMMVWVSQRNLGIVLFGRRHNSHFDGLLIWQEAALHNLGMMFMSESARAREHPPYPHVGQHSF